MIIDKKLLFSYSATERRFKKGQVIFRENDSARYFFIVLEGSVKMCNHIQDGKEFFQGIFGIGESFGEPPVFINEPYPANAIAIENSNILMIHREKLLHLLKDHPVYYLKFIECLARRVYNKALASRENINPNPETKILGFLNNYKKLNGLVSQAIIPYTRQQIANFTGLRVETVIRTLSRMKNNNRIEIVNRKLLY